MKLALRIVRYVLTWPTFFGYLFPLIMVAIFFAKSLRFEEDAVLAATWRPWVEKRWKYHQTAARGMVFRSDASPRGVQHEYVHVRQQEDRILLALVLALVVSIFTLNPWWMFLWPSGVLWQAPNFVMAVLRGGHIYRDAEHERSAYAQSDLKGRAQRQSWLTDHENKEQHF